jgi:cytochrome c
MKKILIITSIVIGIAACGGKSDKKEETGNKPAGTETPAGSGNIADNPAYHKGVELAASNDCATCHRTSGKLTGPSYEEIAAKYPNADDAKITELAATIIKGVAAGKGQWGQQEMTAHPKLSEADAKAMVQYILLFKK